MMIPEPVRRTIQAEFDVAESARGAGNGGMVRVCARRAAGAAIGHWLSANLRPGWEADALGRLRRLQTDPAIPPGVREAAGRLTSRVRADFRAPHPEDPLTDARTIIRHLLGDDVA